MYAHRVAHPPGETATPEGKGEPLYPGSLGPAQSCSGKHLPLAWTLSSLGGPQQKHCVQENGLHG